MRASNSRRSQSLVVSVKKEEEELTPLDNVDETSRKVDDSRRPPNSSSTAVSSPSTTQNNTVNNNNSSHFNYFHHHHALTPKRASSSYSSPSPLTSTRKITKQQKQQGPNFQQYPLLSTVTSAIKNIKEEEEDDDDHKREEINDIQQNLQFSPDEKQKSQNLEVTVPPPTTTASSADQDYCEVIFKDDSSKENKNDSTNSLSQLILHSELELMENVRLRSRRGRKTFCASDLLEKNHVIAVEEEDVSRGRTVEDIMMSGFSDNNTNQNKRIPFRQQPYKITFHKPFTAIVLHSLIHYCSEEELEELTRKCFDCTNTRTCDDDADNNNNNSLGSEIKTYLKRRRHEIETRKLTCVEKPPNARSSSSSSSDDSSTSSSSTSSLSDLENDEDVPKELKPKKSSQKQRIKTNTTSVEDHDLLDEGFTPNCMVVSLITGNPSQPHTLQCTRSIIATCRIPEGETLVVDPVSVFKSYDEETWVLLSDQKSTKEQFESLLSTSTLNSDSTSCHDDYYYHSQLEVLIGASPVPIQSRSNRQQTVPLSKYWPRRHYYHGIGNTVKEEISTNNNNNINNNNNNNSKNNHESKVAYPFTLIELRPCPELNGELELVAATDTGVPHGTAFVYGGILAEPRKKAEARKTKSTSISTTSTSTSTSTSIKQKNTSKHLTQQKGEARIPSVDTENFIYSYEAGEDKIVLGNSLPRYINHKLNFAPSGNVQFVNITLNRKVTYLKSNEQELIARGIIDEHQVQFNSDEKNSSSASSSRRRSRSSNKTKTNKARRSTNDNGNNDADSSQNDSIIKTVTTTKIIPIFLVVSDLVSKHETLLSDSYGAPYDAEMERYIACVGNEPLSAVDVERIRRMSNNNNLLMKRRKQLSVTHGYTAAYRHAVDRGSILAKVVNTEIQFYFVHAVCWGDARRTADDDDDDSSSSSDDGDERPIHLRRLHGYFKQVITKSSSSFNGDNDEARCTLSCPSNPRFVLAEQLDNIDYATQITSKKERSEIFATLKETGTSLYNCTGTDDDDDDDVNSSSMQHSCRFLYRKSSPNDLLKASTSLTASIDNPNSNNNNSNNNTELHLLDANSCVLCLPFRDGLWPVDVSFTDEQQDPVSSSTNVASPSTANQTSNSVMNNKSNKKKVTTTTTPQATSSSKQATRKVQAFIFTNVQKMLENYEALWETREEIENRNNKNHNTSSRSTVEDAAMFSLLRKADLIQPK